MRHRNKLLLLGLIVLVGLIVRLFVAARRDIRQYDLNERLWSATCEDPATARTKVRQLLAEGADPNFRDAGFTPLQNARGRGDAAIIQMLIAAGAKE